MVGLRHDRGNGTVALGAEQARPLDTTMTLFTLLLAGNVAIASPFSLVATATD